MGNPDQPRDERGRWGEGGGGGGPGPANAAQYTNAKTAADRATAAQVAQREDRLAAVERGTDMMGFPVAENRPGSERLKDSERTNSLGQPLRNPGDPGSELRAAAAASRSQAAERQSAARVPPLRFGGGSREGRDNLIKGIRASAQAKERSQKLTPLRYRSK